MGFREQGFLPAAVLNFLALLGWHPDTEQEIFSLKQLIEHFQFRALIKLELNLIITKLVVQRTIFSHTPNNDLATAALQIAPENLKNTSLAYLSQVFGLMKERLTFGKDISTEKFYFLLALRLTMPKLSKKMETRIDKLVCSIKPIVA